MSKLWTVTKDVYINMIKSPTFIILLLSPIFMAVLMGVIYLLSMQSLMTTDYSVAVVGDSPLIADIRTVIDENADVKTDIKSAEQADKALKDKEIQAYYNVSGEADKLAIQFINRNDSPMIEQTAVTAELQNLEQKIVAKSLNLSPSDISKLTTPTWQIESITKNYDPVTGEESNVDLTGKMVSLGVAYATSIGIFVFIAVYAQLVTTEIASEKGTRIMEILLSCTSANTQFLGKVLGIILAILTQLLIFSGGIGLLLNPAILKLLPIPAGFVEPVLAAAGKLAGSSLAMFAIGIFTYIVLAAMLGSFANKPEDAQKVITPLMVVSLAGFYIGIFSMMSPEATFVSIASYFPFFTPFVMPFRVAAETVTTTNLWISIFVMLLTAIGMLYLSMWIYKQTVLMYDDGNLWTKLKRIFSSKKPKEA